MKVLIVGAGLIGVASAYFLADAGHEVTVLERRAGVGQETSFANGALLHPSFTEPWNSPGCWRVLLRSLARSDSALKLHTRTLPSMIPWGIQFLLNSRRRAFERNTQSNLRLALYSMQAMQSIRDSTAIDYGRRTRGSLRIFRDPRAFRKAIAVARARSSQGLAYRCLSNQEARGVEPALEAIHDRIVGAIHYRVDEIGDAHLFCLALAEIARMRGVEFRFMTQVTSLAVNMGRVISAGSATEHFEADHCIVAAGSYTPVILRTLGLRVPIQPAKGYSITVKAGDGAPTLLIPILDDQLHAAVVPLAGALRIAGTAEFAGFDLTLHEHRIGNLMSLLRGVLPEHAALAKDIHPWCGLRPMSPDGVPLIGRTSIANLWINAGHGHLGWTMAAGSARLIRDLIDGKAARIDSIPYDARRFT